MKKIAPITFAYVYLEKDASEERTDMAYARLFRQAWQNMLDKQSTQKYTER